MHTEEQIDRSDAHRLPTQVVPRRYDLVLAPDLATGTFTGTVDVTLEVLTASDVLVCNAAELEVRSAWVETASGRQEATATLDPDLEQVTFDIGATIAPGTATLHVEFTGILNDRLRGFYRSTFVDAEGATRSIAVTQFEATDARRAFPCWDEPSFKAVFGVTLDVAEDLVAISNGPELARVPGPGGRVRVSFADTMPMSTYLVAFVVGPLETTHTVDAGGVPLRIVFTPGQRELAQFALEVGTFALDFFADYYGIAYPGDKLDMVAVPDFAFGAMENLGCVVYRETLLLVDPATATQSDLLAVTDVIAHELAHMWFGDLVTMAWWNGIWLNEAFATFMETKCSDAFRPEWVRWMHFGRERSGAFEIDALEATRPIEYPVITPADAEGMFDTLTYQKGSAVVRMLEQFLGEDAFRDGIRRYLQTHQFGNTETGDLWDALEAETGEPVRAMMDTWIFQGGFPQVSVRSLDRGIEVSQSVFRSDATSPGPDTSWHVPLLVRDASGTTKTVLRETTEVIDADAEGPVVVNAGGYGFYRVSYDDGLLARLLDDVAALRPLERYVLLDDTRGLAVNGTVEAATLATLVDRIAATGEDDLSIWQLVAVAVDDLDRAVDAADAPVVDAWVRRVTDALWKQLGPTTQPGDDDRRRALRGVVLDLRGGHGEPEAVALADELFRASRADHVGVPDGSLPGIDPELAAAAVRIVARDGGADVFDRLLHRFRNAATPQETVRHLYAAATTSDPALFERYLDLLATDEVRSQNLAFAYRAALRNPRHGARAWAAIEDRWTAIRARLPFNALHRLIEGVAALSDPDLADRVVAFVADEDIPEAGQLVAQHVERMQVRVAFRAREADRLPDRLR